jgi:protein-S-isoprenylcysteine O-methyltransferase Ste14
VLLALDELRGLGRGGLSVRRLLERCGPFFYRHRTYLLPATLLFVVAVSRPVAPRGSGRLDTILDLAGLAIALTGQALRAAVIGYAYIRRGGKDGKAYADDLVTGGLFAHARNPLYLGNLLILYGLLVMYNSLAGYLIVAPFLAFFYAAIVASEEVYLRGRFGSAFDDYCRRAPRWIPDFHGLRASIAGMRFNWPRLVRKEYGSAFAWIAAALLLRVLEVATMPAYAADRPGLAWYALPIGIAVASWAVARVMKKKRLLTDRPALSTARG